MLVVAKYLSAGGPYHYFLRQLFPSCFQLLQRFSILFNFCDKHWVTVTLCPHGSTIKDDAKKSQQICDLHASTTPLNTSFCRYLNQISLLGTRAICRCQLAFPSMSGFYLSIFYRRTMKVTSKRNMISKRCTMVCFLQDLPSLVARFVIHWRKRNSRWHSPRARLFIFSGI